MFTFIFSGITRARNIPWTVIYLVITFFKLCLHVTRVNTSVCIMKYSSCIQLIVSVRFVRFICKDNIECNENLEVNY